MYPVDQVFAHGINDLSVVVAARANAEMALASGFFSRFPPPGPDFGRKYG
jgi:hypothetical protein